MAEKNLFIPSGLLHIFPEIFPGVLVKIDRKGSIQWHNPNLTNLTGLSSAELLKNKWYKIFDSIDPTLSSEKFFHTLSAGQKSSSIITILSRSKERPLYTEWHFKTLSDCPGKRNCIIATGWDITEWISKEEQLLKERFHLIERNKELICLYGISQITGNSELSFESKIRHIVELIPQALQYPDQASARIGLDQDYYHSPGFDNPDPDLCLHEKFFIEGKQRGIVEVFYSRKNADEISRSPSFLMEERSLLRIIARQLALVLEHREADIKQNELQIQLRHADRLAKIGQLSAGIAHEINTPLGNILGFAQLAAKTRGLPEQVDSDLDRIVKSCLHAREIIRKLMLFSRQLPPRQEASNLNSVVEHSLDFIEHICVKGKVSVIRNFAADLPDIMLDPGQMNQVIMNLVINAVHAMPSGGILTLKTGYEDGNVFLIVQDNGTGIDPDVMEQIFLPFFSTKELDHGTGLGLSVVHGIIQAHGGRIEATSQKGEGTNFTIIFSIDGGG